MVKIIADNEIAYLVAALDEQRQVLSHRYLIIPKTHTESLLDLPANWHASMSELIQLTPEYELGIPFNISYNEGKAAGQRISHTHVWLVFRQGEEGSSSENLGLSALLTQARPQNQAPV